MQKELLSALLKLAEVIEIRPEWFDLSAGNIMQRADGTLVLVDPRFGGKEETLTRKDIMGRVAFVAILQAMVDTAKDEPVSAAHLTSIYEHLAQLDAIETDEP